MANSAGESFWWSVILIIVAIWWYNRDPEDSDNYKKGYEVGQADGYENGRIAGKNAVCEEIESFSNSIHTTLWENSICE